MIHWLLQACGSAEQDLDWLTPSEKARFSALAVEKRRSDWLLGRYAAKRVVFRALRRRAGGPFPLSFLEIGVDASGAPFARLAPDAVPLGGLLPGHRLPLSLSISHSGGTAMAAVLLHEDAGEETADVGADLERLEPRSEGLVDDFFTEEERAEVRSVPAPERNLRVNSIWSAKEAVLKALGLGLTVDTRDVVCRFDGELAESAPEPLSPPEPAWRRFAVQLAPGLLGGSRIHGFFRASTGFVLTLAVRRGTLSAAERRTPSRVAVLNGR